jgi:hypothetical protein
MIAQCMRAPDSEVSSSEQDTKGCEAAKQATVAATPCLLLKPQPSRLYLPHHSLRCSSAAAAQIQAAAAAGDLLDTQRGTQRSNMPGSNLVTARLVDIDVPDAADKPGRAPAHLAASPTGSDEVSLSAQNQGENQSGQSDQTAAACKHHCCRHSLNSAGTMS